MTTYSSQHLLYLKTAISNETETRIQYSDYHITVPFTPQKMIHYLLELNHTSLQVQSSKAKRLLNINKLIPIYCLLYTSPSPRDATLSRMPSSA